MIVIGERKITTETLIPNDRCINNLINIIIIMTTYGGIAFSQEGSDGEGGQATFKFFKKFCFFFIIDTYKQILAI
jgi:hypothetical protein